MMLRWGCCSVCGIKIGVTYRRGALPKFCERHRPPRTAAQLVWSRANRDARRVANAQSYRANRQNSAQWHAANAQRAKAWRANRAAQQATAELQR